jgi:hypothetical protein
LSGISSARSHDPPGGGGITTPNARGILAAVLDQLLAGADPYTVLLPKGLLEELKPAAVGRLLDAGTDGDPAGDGTSNLRTHDPPHAGRTGRGPYNPETMHERRHDISVPALPTSRSQLPSIGAG